MQLAIHSGSVFDLCYVIDPDGFGDVIRDRPAPLPIRRTILGSDSVHRWRLRRRVSRDEDEAEVLLFAAGKDHQGAASQANAGALTRAFLASVNDRHQDLTYRLLLDQIRNRMHDAGHLELVQLSISRCFSIKNKVVL